MFETKKRVCKSITTTNVGNRNHTFPNWDVYFTSIIPYFSTQDLAVLKVSLIL
jgi:hypothetical protein